MSFVLNILVCFFDTIPTVPPKPSNSVVVKSWRSCEDGCIGSRPTVISTHPYLGVSKPYTLLLYLITSPVGPYCKSGFAPVRLTADTEYVRAWPGGTGNAKVGGNYEETAQCGDIGEALSYSLCLLFVFLN